MRLQLTSTKLLLRAAALFCAAAAACGCGSSGPEGEGPAPKTPEVDRPNRLSVTVQQDFGIVSGQAVCSANSQIYNGFSCFRSDQTQYHGTPLSQDGGDPGGVYLATTRVLAGYDRVVFDNFTIGGRVGVVLRGGGPKPDGRAAPSFLPFHGELRAAYWFGSAPFVGTGFRAGLFAAGGIAQVDSTWQVDVVEDTSKPPPAAQPTNPPSQTLDAYQKAGTGWVGGGLSLAYAFLPSSAFVLHLKVMQLFPSTGTVLAPEFGYEHAF